MVALLALGAGGGSLFWEAFGATSSSKSQGDTSVVVERDLPVRREARYDGN